MWDPICMSLYTFYFKMPFFEGKKGMFLFHNVTFHDSGVTPPSHLLANHEKNDIMKGDIMKKI